LILKNLSIISFIIDDKKIVHKKYHLKRFMRTFINRNNTEFNIKIILGSQYLFYGMVKGGFTYKR